MHCPEYINQKETTDLGSWAESLKYFGASIDNLVRQSSAKLSLMFLFCNATGNYFVQIS